jgi:hypothetical protein
MKRNEHGKHRTGESKGVVVIAFLNFLGYLYDLFPFLLVASFFGFGLWLYNIILLYFVLGLFCSWKLFKHRTWSWYLAITMWVSEGIIILWTSTTSLYELYPFNLLFYPANLLAYPANILVFLSVGVYRFASVAYLLTERVRKLFAVDLRRQPIDYLRSFRTGSEYKASVQD